MGSHGEFSNFRVPGTIIMIIPTIRFNKNFMLKDNIILATMHVQVKPRWVL